MNATQPRKYWAYIGFRIIDDPNPNNKGRYQKEILNNQTKHKCENENITEVIHINIPVKFNGGNETIAESKNGTNAVKDVIHVTRINITGNFNNHQNRLKAFSEQTDDDYHHLKEDHEANYHEIIRIVLPITFEDLKPTVATNANFTEDIIINNSTLEENYKNNTDKA